MGANEITKKYSKEGDEKRYQWLAGVTWIKIQQKKTQKLGSSEAGRRKAKRE